MLTEFKGENIAMREMRKHVAWYTKGMKASSAIRNEVCKTEKLSELFGIIDRYIQYLSNGDEIS